MDGRHTITELFEEQVKLLHDAPALIAADQALSYVEFNQKANQFAQLLIDKGVKPQTLVAICLERSVKMMVVIWGVIKAGAAYVPLDPSHPDERLLTILEDANAPFLITTTSLKEHFASYSGKIITINDKMDELTPYASDNPSVAISAKDLIYIIYTSGSTGQPKGVLIEHQSVVNYAKWFSQFTHCQIKERIDFSSNYIFDMSITSLLIPLTLGLTIVICDEETKRNLPGYLQFLKTYRINITKMTPSYFNALLQEVIDNPIDLPDLKSIILGGEVLKTALCQHWLGYYPQHILFNEYGPTETTVAVTVYAITKNNVQQLPNFAPIGESGPHIYCYVLDENRQVVTAGKMGELYIGGICLARGYLNAKELTAKKFINNPFIHNEYDLLYRTGDRCAILPDGNLQFIERVDQQIKIRGFRIDVSEIENFLTARLDIKSAAVIALFNESAGENQLYAYYVPKNTTQLSGQVLRKYLEVHLPDYMIPTFFIPLTILPLTASGKLDQKALPHALPNHKLHLMPRNKTEQMMVDMWEEVLHLDCVGIKDNFFELGGHSLTAARIIAKMKKTINPQIEIQDLYRAPTILQLAEVVKDLPIVLHQESIDQELHSVKFRTLGEFQFLFWVANLFEPRTKKINVAGRKRLPIKIDADLLRLAFADVLKNNPILNLRVSNTSPALYYQPKAIFHLSETDISHLPQEQQELVLLDSLHQLAQHYPWKKSIALVVAKLFYLNDNLSELQLSIAHIIADDVSRDIVFKELSDFYQARKNQSTFSIQKHHTFQEYVSKERKKINAQLDADIAFWQDYLKNANLFVVPENYLAKHLHAQGIPYSTYLELPKEWVKLLHQRCKTYQVSITGMLSAAIGIALMHHNHCHNQAIFLNIIKSTREDEIYDNEIGCFLRAESLKLHLTKKSTLQTLLTQIKTDIIDTAPHQLCPGMVKFACIEFYQHYHSKVDVLIKPLLKIYPKLFAKFKLNPTILTMYGRLVQKKRNGLMINLNIWNNFLNSEQPQPLFGHTPLNTPLHQYDLCPLDNFLDLSFLKDENQQKYYLVLSSNLHPALREQLGKEIMEAITTEKAEKTIPVHSH